MYPRLSAFLFSMFCMLFSHMTTLDAASISWGKTEKTVEHEGISWNGVSINLQGFYLSALIPNYNGGSLQDNEVTLRGFRDNFNYLINTNFNGDYKPAAKIKEFVKVIQKANPDYDVTEADGSHFGAKFAVHLSPKKKAEEQSFWLFLATKDRLVQIGTEETNKEHRQYFFESVRVN